MDMIQKEIDNVARKFLRQVACFYKEMDLYSISEIVDGMALEQCANLIEIASIAVNELGIINDYRRLWNDGEFIGEEEFTFNILERIGKTIEITMELISLAEKYDEDNESSVFGDEINRCGFKLLSDRIMEFNLVMNISTVNYYMLNP